MLLKEKIKLIRKEFGLSQQELAIAIGSKVGKIKQIETGATATISYADAKLIESRFRISEQWLRFDIGEMYVELDLNDFDMIKNDFTNNKISIKLPYYSDIKASAGTGCILNENENEFIQIPANLLSKNNYSKLEVISVHGDSMQPTFNDNDLIVIDKNKKDIINGKVFIVFYENDLYIKRIFQMPKNKIIMKSDNMYYPDIEISNDNFQIIGQVIKALNFKSI